MTNIPDDRFAIVEFAWCLWQAHTGALRSGVIATAIRIEPMKPFGGLASADLHRPRLGVLVQL